MTHNLIILEDNNSNCTSIMAAMALPIYINLVEKAYEDQGGLLGQRAPIKTKTGLKIRSRLIQDIRNGAVIPPIVVGAVTPSQTLKQLKKLTTTDELVEKLMEAQIDLSIIDGMQRTTALIEASKHDIENSFEPIIRVEFWLARKVESLIYRMLVLNTGQVPWDLKRQLETLYRPIVSKIANEVSNIHVIGLDQNNRRSQAGEYRSTRIIELFLAFTSRSIDVDIRERVAEEFAKVDITEATSNEKFFPLFIETIKLLSSLDSQFDRVSRELVSDEESKVKCGRDIFTSAPASIGFVVAVAEKLLGTPGFNYDITIAIKEMEKIKKNIKTLIKHMDSLSNDQLKEFIDFDTLNQVLTAKSSRIGEYERSLYKRAFLILMSKTNQIIDQGTLTPCWQAR